MKASGFQSSLRYALAGRFPVFAALRLGRQVSGFWSQVTNLRRVIFLKPETRHLTPGEADGRRWPV
jgi:hypothetical protein